MRSSLNLLQVMTTGHILNNLNMDRTLPTATPVHLVRRAEDVFPKRSTGHLRADQGLQMVVALHCPLELLIRGMLFDMGSPQVTGGTALMGTVGPQQCLSLGLFSHPGHQVISSHRVPSESTE